MDPGSSPGLSSLCGHRQVIYPPQLWFSHQQIGHDLLELAVKPNVLKHLKNCGCLGASLPGFKSRHLGRALLWAHFIAGKLVFVRSKLFPFDRRGNRPQSHSGARVETQAPVTTCLTTTLRVTRVTHVVLRMGPGSQ